jgi:hypothetical protein
MMCIAKAEGVSAETCNAVSARLLELGPGRLCYVPDKEGAPTPCARIKAASQSTEPPE